MKILLHVCCAPCLLGCLAALAALKEEKARGKNIEPTLFWYNPNIQPQTEYIKRRDTLVQYAQNQNMSLILEEHQELKLDDGPRSCTVQRSCTVCYRIRMEKTAIKAKEQGFNAFSSTLFISPYQNHDMLKQEAEDAAAQYGIDFLYQDFRPFFRSAQEKARHLSLYRQKYCGCIFSKESK